MSEYLPIPVSVAKQIASAYSRDIVVVCAWSHEHKLLHTTTYGIAAPDKVWAATAGELCAKALMTDLEKAEFSEDFRKDHDAAREVAMAEAIELHLPELRKMAAQIISPANNVLSRMVRDFERASATNKPNPV